MGPTFLLHVICSRKYRKFIFLPVVCIGLSHEFGVVRLYRTFSNRIFTRGSRCVGYLYTTSGRFNCSELPRTFSTTLVQLCTGVLHEFGVVRLYRTFSNHIFTRKSRCVVYLYTCSRWFNRSEPPRTFMNRFNTEKAMCVEVYHMCSKWFDCTEPFRTTYSQGDQAVYGTYTLVPGGSTAANLLEPSRTT